MQRQKKGLELSMWSLCRCVVVCMWGLGRRVVVCMYAVCRRLNIGYGHVFLEELQEPFFSLLSREIGWTFLAISREELEGWETIDSYPFNFISRPIHLRDNQIRDMTDSFSQFI
jgi:hypothetical protein